MRALALLLVTVASSTSCLYATQPPLRIGDADAVVGVPRLLPGEVPKGVLVFLHGLSTEPWIEEQEGIAATVEFGVAHGYVVVVPFADRVCSAAQRCWPTRPDRSSDDAARFAAVLPLLDRVVRDVEKRVSARGLDRYVVGYSNGGYFLAGALERGLLSGGAWKKVGIAAGGPVGEPQTTPLRRAPLLSLTAFDDDEFQGPAMVTLAERLQSRGLGVALDHQPGPHVWSAAHAVTFLAAFLDVAPVVAPAVAPDVD